MLPSLFMPMQRTTKKEGKENQDSSIINCALGRLSLCSLYVFSTQMSNFITKCGEQIRLCFNSKHLSFMILAKTQILQPMIFFFFSLISVFYNIGKAWSLPVRKGESMPILILQEKRGNKGWFLTKIAVVLNILMLPINYIMLPLTGQDLAQINLSLFQLSLLELKCNQLSMQRPEQRPSQRQNKMLKRKQLFLCSHLIGNGHK